MSYVTLTYISRSSEETVIIILFLLFWIIVLSDLDDGADAYLCIEVGKILQN